MLAPLALNRFWSVCRTPSSFSRLVKYLLSKVLGVVWSKLLMTRLGSGALAQCFKSCASSFGWMTLVSLRKKGKLLVNRGVTAAHLALPKVWEPAHTTTIKDQQVSFICCCNTPAVHQRRLHWSVASWILNSTKLNLLHIEDLYKRFTATAGTRALRRLSDLLWISPEMQSSKNHR